MSQFFPNVPKIEYEGADSKNPLSFKFYNPDEVILGKTMAEHLKFAMSYWHTMVAGGRDMFGVETWEKTYGEAGDPVAEAKAKADAAFELMEKLQIEYFCFHDRDIVDEGDTIEETNARLDAVTDHIQGLMDKTGIKLLWGTANLFTNPRYMNGAGTSPSFDVYAFAAQQVKKALELTVKLGGTGYVFWGGREGYETLLNTDIGLEQDNMAALMTMVRDYGRKIGFEGDFYIEPKPREPMTEQYDFDAATSLNFLRKYGLLGDFKLNIEANHATLAGHTFAHELRVATINDAFGSVDANKGNEQLGWDTDEFPADIYETTYAVLEILKAGGFTNGGLNFDAKSRRTSNRPEDLFLAYILGMDSFALGLRKAAALQADGRLEQAVADRYQSWSGNLASKVTKREASLEEVASYALENEDVAAESGRQEELESIVNQVFFG